MRNLIDAPSRKLNRLSAHRPKTGKFWCGCDTRQVGRGEKCPACGQRFEAHRKHHNEI